MFLFFGHAERIEDTKHGGLQTRLASCSQDQGEYLALLHRVANPLALELWHFAMADMAGAAKFSGSHWPVIVQYAARVCDT